jgi:hypothetical protein
MDTSMWDTDFGNLLITDCTIVDNTGRVSMMVGWVWKTQLLSHRGDLGKGPLTLLLFLPV